MSKQTIDRVVRWWLFVGVVMIFFQVVLGGITRLTDSGLSITEWAVIQGVLPPRTTAAWEEAFEAYKRAAAKQYETVHRQMSLEEFKRIYYWEYLHRLWARSMGLVFLLPFLIFLRKRMLPVFLLKKLGVVILLALLAAVFGWVMVLSGLNDDQRTWVSAYKLVVHLFIATALYAYLFWTWRTAGFARRAWGEVRGGYVWFVVVLALAFFQIALGGLMAGMRAALVFPFFPAVGGPYDLLALLRQQAPAGMSWEHFLDYEPSIWIKALVQLLHRLTAWLLVVLTLWTLWTNRKFIRSSGLDFHAGLLISLLILQLTLGIFTVINSLGKVPVLLGVLHQAGALLFLGALLSLMAAWRYERK